MRLSFFATILPIVLSLASLTAARGYDSGLSYEARNYVDELATREILSELTTRELMDELSDRLERRETKVICAWCLTDWGKRSAENFKGMADDRVPPPYLYRTSLSHNAGAVACVFKYGEEPRL
ncbi:hypothetical protein DFP72DRAFT_852551 [Ephemerocybe angulata]|uniref:Uncharacterized protein n=1 Tax=Ephemerocybe angulata TaxID=980116 RepID=A0A8H6M137_9AGAR|nr:hypothetical protein DFP72DRAFT_852551 [Tulosesus angulatus]